MAYAPPSCATGRPGLLAPARTAHLARRYSPMDVRDARLVLRLREAGQRIAPPGDLLPALNDSRDWDEFARRTRAQHQRAIRSPAPGDGPTLRPSSPSTSRRSDLHAAPHLFSRACRGVPIAIWTSPPPASRHTLTTSADRVDLNKLSRGRVISVPRISTRVGLFPTPSLARRRPLRLVLLRLLRLLRPTGRALHLCRRPHRHWGLCVGCPHLRRMGLRS